jgi:hypothetical protein
MAPCGGTSVVTKIYGLAKGGQSPPFSDRLMSY